jgi:aspartyl-tRNA(Asn)/glutamyl-tRNA(Gln) amidotransferase subunit C
LTVVERKPDVAHIDVRYVADLARISLSDAEARQFGAELDAILEYVAQLNELEVDGIEPTAHAAPRVNVMRDDVVTPSLDHDVVIANAPAEIDDAYIRVPVVLEEGSSS